MKSFQYSTFLFLMVLLSSCSDYYEEDISNVLQHKENEKTIAISSLITSDYKRQTVVVSRSIDFIETYVSSGGNSTKIKDPLLHRRVGGAKIFVEVAGKKYEFKEIHTTGHLYRQRENDWPEDIPYDEIYYESVDSFAGIPNQEHRLVVEVEGKIYTATDVMPQVSEISFNEKSPLCRKIDIIGDEDHQVKEIPTVFPAYLFGQKESYIMGFNPISIYSVKQGDYDEVFSRFGNGPCISFRQLATPQLMGGVGIGYVQVCPSPGSKHDKNLTDTVVVTKISCSQSYEYYLYCLFQTKTGNGNDFGNISSNVPTNISNGGMGFFAACDVSRQIFSKKELVQLAESIGNIIE